MSLTVGTRRGEARRGGLRSPDGYGRRVRAARVGLVLALLLATLGMAVPAVLDWDVHVRWFPPLHAEWDPRVGWGTVPAVLLGVLAWRYAVDLAAPLPWRRLLWRRTPVGWPGCWRWRWSTGSVGIGDVLDHPYEYLDTARATHDLPHPSTSTSAGSRSTRAGNWPVHIAGHPPGALTFFVLLVRLGLGSGLAAGLVVTLRRGLDGGGRAADAAHARRRAARAAGRAVPGHRTGRGLAVRVGGRDVRGVRGLGDVRAGAGRRGFILLAQRRVVPRSPGCCWAGA